MEPAQTCADGASLPQPVPLVAELVWLPFVFVTLGLGLALYPQMPEQVPMHIDLAGNVTEYAEKSLWLALFPAFLQLFVGACFVVAHWSVVRTPRRSDSHKATADGAYARAVYARAWSRYVLWVGVALATGLACMPLAFAGIVSLGVFGLVMVVIAAAALVAAAVLTACYGLDSTRAASRAPQNLGGRGRGKTRH